MSLTDIVTRDTPIHMSPPRWRVIIRETCAEFGIPADVLLVPYGPRRYVAARITLARRLSTAGYGYAQIGRWLHRDHATVLWYCGRKKSHNLGQPVNDGPDPIPPPISIFVLAAQRRDQLMTFLSSKWITARALATITGFEFDKVREDLKCLQATGLVQRSGYERPAMWRLA